MLTIFGIHIPESFKVPKWVEYEKGRLAGIQELLTVISSMPLLSDADKLRIKSSILTIYSKTFDDHQTNLRNQVFEFKKSKGLWYEGRIAKKTSSPVITRLPNKSYSSSPEGREATF